MYFFSALGAAAALVLLVLAARCWLSAAAGQKRQGGAGARRRGALGSSARADAGAAGEERLRFTSNPLRQPLPPPGRPPRHASLSFTQFSNARS